MAPKSNSNASMNGKSPKKMKLTPEEARLEIQASVRFANARTNEFTDFVRAFRGNKFQELVDGMQKAQTRISDSLVKCRTADGGMADKEYELLIDNTLRDMRSAIQQAKAMEKTVLSADEFKKCEHGALHARDQLYQLIRKAKPTQELSPVNKVSSPLHASMAASSKGPFSGMNNFHMEKTAMQSQREVSVQSGAEPTMFMNAMRNPDMKVNVHANMKPANMPSKNKKANKKAPPPNSVSGGLLMQKLNKAPTPSKAKAPAQKAKPQPQKMMQAKTPARPAKMSMGKGRGMSDPKNLINKRGIFKCTDKSGKMHPCVLMGACPGNGCFKVSVTLKNGTTMTNVIVKGSELSPSIPKNMIVPMAPAGEFGTVDAHSMNQRGFYECCDKRGMFYECIVHGRVNNHFRCTVMSSKGMTLKNVLVEPHNIRPLGTKMLSIPVDWTSGGVPSRGKELIVQDTQDMQMDWGCNGIPKSIKGTDWSAYYNASNGAIGGAGPRLIVDWSVRGLPMTISNDAGADWAKGAFEYMYDPEVLTMDWSMMGMPAMQGDLKWIKKANKFLAQDDFACDWSVIGLPMRVDSEWGASFMSVQRGMLNGEFKKAAKDKMRFCMDWSCKGMPEEAEGQPWTKYVGGDMAERIRCLRKINKQINQELGSPINPKKAVSSKNIKLDQMNSVKQAILTGIDFPVNVSKIRGEGAQLAQRMQDVRSMNRKAAIKTYRAEPTNKNRKALNKEMYNQRMNDLSRQLHKKRENRKMWRLRNREGKMQLRSGLGFQDMPAETMYVHKHGPRSNANRPNTFVYGTRDRYEAKDQNGKWWNCVVKTCLGDGNYLVSIPCTDGITYGNNLVNHTNIRPHLLHNVKGIYEAVDDEGIWWDVTVNEHLQNGHVNINVVADDGTQYDELKTHWNQVRVKIHLNVPNLYEAMDRQGHHWPILVTRKLAGDMYCFSCFFGDEVIENLKCHHHDIRLVSQENLGMSQNQMQMSGMLPKQSRQMSFKHMRSMQPVARKPMPTTAPPPPPMPMMAPPRPMSKASNNTKKSKGKKNTGMNKKDMQYYASHEIKLNTRAWQQCARMHPSNWKLDDTWVIVMQSGPKMSKTQQAPAKSGKNAKGKKAKNMMKQSGSPTSAGMSYPRSLGNNGQPSKLKVDGLYRSAPVRNFTLPAPRYTFTGKNNLKQMKLMQASAMMMDQMMMKCLNKGMKGKSRPKPYMKDMTWMEYVDVPSTKDVKKMNNSMNSRNAPAASKPMGGKQQQKHRMHRG